MEAYNKTPYLAIGKIIMNKGIIKRQFASGSIVKGGRYPIIATAAHCVFNLKNKEFFQDVFFQPVQLNRKKYRVSACALSVDFIEYGNLEHDTAYLIMEEDFNQESIYHEVALDIKFQLSKELNYDIFGYTHRGKASSIARGTAIKDSYKHSSLQGITCKEKDGMSGGPWITKHEHKIVQNSISILSFKSVENIMWGPYWGKILEMAYKTAKTKNNISPDIYLHYF